MGADTTRTEMVVAGKVKVCCFTVRSSLDNKWLWQTASIDCYDLEANGWPLNMKQINSCSKKSATLRGNCSKVIVQALYVEKHQSRLGHHAATKAETLATTSSGSKVWLLSLWLAAEVPVQQVDVACRCRCRPHKATDCGWRSHRARRSCSLALSISSPLVVTNSS